MPCNHQSNPDSRKRKPELPEPRDRVPKATKRSKQQARAAATHIPTDPLLRIMDVVMHSGGSYTKTPSVVPHPASTMGPCQNRDVYDRFPDTFYTELATKVYSWFCSRKINPQWHECWHQYWHLLRCVCQTWKTLLDRDKRSSPDFELEHAGFEGLVVRTAPNSAAVCIPHKKLLVDLSLSPECIAFLPCPVPAKLTELVRDGGQISADDPPLLRKHTTAVLWQMLVTSGRSSVALRDLLGKLPDCVSTVEEFRKLFSSVNQTVYSLQPTRSLQAKGTNWTENDEIFLGLRKPPYDINCNECCHITACALYAPNLLQNHVTFKFEDPKAGCGPGIQTVCVPAPTSGGCNCEWFFHLRQNWLNFVKDDAAFFSGQMCEQRKKARVEYITSVIKHIAQAIYQICRDRTEAKCLVLHLLQWRATMSYPMRGVIHKETTTQT